MKQPEDAKQILYIRWWNVNGRWNIADKNFMKNIDIVFICETHGSCLAMPKMAGFEIVGDEKFPLISRHGGNVAYIEKEPYAHMIYLRYSKVSLSFNFSFASNIMFMGTYMYPIDSYNFAESDFAQLFKDINYWMEKGITAFIGGDFNSRVGNMNLFSHSSLKWH